MRPSPMPETSPATSPLSTDTIQVVFTPSGKRRQVAVGKSVLDSRPHHSMGERRRNRPGELRNALPKHNREKGNRGLGFNSTPLNWKCQTRWIQCLAWNFNVQDWFEFLLELGHCIFLSQVFQLPSGRHILVFHCHKYEAPGP